MRGGEREGERGREGEREKERERERERESARARERYTRRHTSFFHHTLAQTSMKYLPQTSRSLKNSFSKPPDFFFISFPVIHIRISIRGGGERGIGGPRERTDFRENT